MLLEKNCHLVKKESILLILNISRKPYLIVEFPEERTAHNIAMAIVADTWIKIENGKHYCIWPSYFHNETQRIKFVMTLEAPDMNRSSLCPVNIKYKSSRYNSALLKMKKLEELSNVSSSSDENSRRTKVHNKLYKENYIDDVSSDDDSLPKVKNPSTKTTVRKTKTTLNDVETSQRANCSPTSELYSNGMCTPTSVRTMGTPCNTTLRQQQNNTLLPIECSCSGKIEGYFKTILKKIEFLRNDVNLLKQQIAVGKISDADVQSHTTGMESNLPITSVAEFHEFNAKLEDEHYMAVVCSSLRVFGGNNPSETTRIILGPLLSHELSLKYNWCGRNGKEDFSKLTNVSKLILMVVRKNPKCNASTKKEVESYIKPWLRNAIDRNGGRSARKKATANDL